MYRVGLTYDLKKDCSRYDDTFAEFDTEDTIEAILCALENCGYKTLLIGDARRLLQLLPDIDVDIVFNISEGGLHGRCREAYVPVILESRCIPYVGSGPATLVLALDKLMTKRILSAVGIPVPKQSRFPFIIKPRYEGSSKGICKDSLVFNQEQLQIRVDWINREYNQPPIVEEFIEGWEFTVAIIGNEPAIEVFPPLQRSVDKITTLASHIIETEEFLEPLPIDEELEQRLKLHALIAYKALGCRDFARVDFRVDFARHDYLLEINPLPSLSKDGSFAILSECLSMSYDNMVARIIDEALKRYDALSAIMV